MNYKCVSLIN